MGFIKSYFRYVALLIIMAAVSQWMILSLYVTSIGQKQQILTEIKEAPLISLIKDLSFPISAVFD